MIKHKTDIRKGFLHFYPNEEGVLYNYLKTFELFEEKYFEMLPDRIKGFSEKTNVYLIEEIAKKISNKLTIGDYVIDDHRICLVVGRTTSWQCNIKYLYDIKKPTVDTVWEGTSGSFRLKTQCCYIPSLKQWVLRIHTRTNDLGKLELHNNVTLSKTAKNIYASWDNGLKKIAASTDNRITFNKFKPKELQSIIDSNGRLQEIQFHYVPNNFIKIKSQSIKK